MLMLIKQYSNLSLFIFLTVIPRMIQINTRRGGYFCCMKALLRVAFANTTIWLTCYYGDIGSNCCLYSNVYHFIKISKKQQQTLNKVPLTTPSPSNSVHHPLEHQNPPEHDRSERNHPAPLNHIDLLSCITPVALRWNISSESSL